MTLTLTAYDPQGSTYTLLDGTGSGVWKLQEANWGNAVWDTQYTGPRGTLGALPTSSTPQNRPLQLGFVQLPPVATDMPGHLRQLRLVVDRMRKHGGRVTAQPSSVSHRGHFEVFAGTGDLASWSNRAEHRGRIQIALQFVCSPYVWGDSMHVTDSFLTDTEANYTFDQGSGANVTVGAGQFRSSAVFGEHTAIHTGRGYPYGDSQAMARIVPQTVLNHEGGVVLKRVSATKFLRALVVDNGSSALTLEWVNVATRSTIATTGLTRITVGLPYHVAIRVEGNTAYAEYWAPTNPPSLGGAATNAVSGVLSGSALTDFGEGVTGQAGVYLRPANANDAVEFFEVRPYVYRGANFSGWSAPDEFRLDGDIPGDAPAAAVVEVAGEGVSADFTRFGMLGWSRRPAVHNLIPDGGGFEDADLWPQWSVAAVAGVTGAATSQTRTAGGRSGRFCNQIVAPATANSGVSCVMRRRFRAGVTYTAEAWVRSAAGTTNLRIRLGVSADIASETASALTAGWVRRTVTWTPTATYTQAFFAAEITAATATTFQIDQVRVYEGTVAPNSVTQLDPAGGGRPPFGLLDPGEAKLGSFLTLTTGASTTNYVRGRFLDYGAGSAGAIWHIDPTLIPVDDQSQGMDVEVWALGRFDGLDMWRAVTREAYASPSSAPQKATGITFTREYGSSGVTTPTGGLWGWLRLGTLPLNPRRGGMSMDTPAATSMQVHVNDVSSTTEITAVLLVPARSRACSPTHKPDDTDYPRFSITTDAWRRVFLPDLRAQDRGPGLGGTVIELPPGPVDMVLATSRYIPGTTSSSITRFRETAALAVTPVPRWHYFRDA